MAPTTAVPKNKSRARGTTNAKAAGKKAETTSTVISQKPESQGGTTSKPFMRYIPPPHVAKKQRPAPKSKGGNKNNSTSAKPKNDTTDYSSDDESDSTVITDLSTDDDDYTFVQRLSGGRRTTTYGQLRQRQGSYLSYNSASESERESVAHHKRGNNTLAPGMLCNNTPSQGEKTQNKIPGSYTSVYANPANSSANESNDPSSSSCNEKNNRKSEDASVLLPKRKHKTLPSMPANFAGGNSNLPGMPANFEKSFERFETAVGFSASPQRQETEQFASPANSHSPFSNKSDASINRSPKHNLEKTANALRTAGTMSSKLAVPRSPGGHSPASSAGSSAGSSLLSPRDGAGKSPKKSGALKLSSSTLHKQPDSSPQFTQSSPVSFFRKIEFIPQIPQRNTSDETAGQQMKSNSSGTESGTDSKNEEDGSFSPTDILIARHRQPMVNEKQPLKKAVTEPLKNSSSSGQKNLSPPGALQNEKNNSTSTINNDSSQVSQRENKTTSFFGRAFKDRVNMMGLYNIESAFAKLKRRGSKDDSQDSKNHSGSSSVSPTSNNCCDAAQEQNNSNLQRGQFSIMVQNHGEQNAKEIRRTETESSAGFFKPGSAHPSSTKSILSIPGLEQGDSNAAAVPPVPQTRTSSRIFNRNRFLPRGFLRKEGALLLRGQRGPKAQAGMKRLINQTVYAGGRAFPDSEYFVGSAELAKSVILDSIGMRLSNADISNNSRHTFQPDSIQMGKLDSPCAIDEELEGKNTTENNDGDKTKSGKKNSASVATKNSLVRFTDHKSTDVVFGNNNSNLNNPNNLGTIFDQNFERGYSAGSVSSISSNKALSIINALIRFFYNRIFF